MISTKQYKPTKDVRDEHGQREREKGQWINDKGLYRCSSCGKLWVHWWAIVVPLDKMYKELKYCPNCGADMRND